MLNLFIVLAGAEILALITAIVAVTWILWLINKSFPGPVIPADDDEIVGDGSTLRQEIL